MTKEQLVTSPRTKGLACLLLATKDAEPLALNPLAPPSPLPHSVAPWDLGAGLASRVIFLLFVGL